MNSDITADQIKHIRATRNLALCLMRQAVVPLRRLSHLPRLNVRGHLATVEAKLFIERGQGAEQGGI